MAKTTKKAPAKKSAGKSMSKKSAPAKKTTAKKSPGSKATAKKSTAKSTAKSKPMARKSSEGRSRSMTAAKSGKKPAAKRSTRSAAAGTTTDHEEIRRWAEERGGKPACVMGTGGGGDTGLLRLEFPDQPYANDGKLQEITWEEFFQKFDDQGLALLYQESTKGGQPSNFNKLVSRKTAKANKR